MGSLGLLLWSLGWSLWLCRPPLRPLRLLLRSLHIQPRLFSLWSSLCLLRQTLCRCRGYATCEERLSPLLRPMPRLTLRPIPGCTTLEFGEVTTAMPPTIMPPSHTPTLPTHTATSILTTVFPTLTTANRQLKLESKVKISVLIKNA